MRTMTALAGRVRQVCHEVRTSPDAVLREAEFDDRIEAVSGEIRAQVRCAPADARATGELVAMLAMLATARGDLLERISHQESGDLAALYDQLDLLARCESLAALPQAAASAASACCGLDRVFISEVRGATWSLLAIVEPETRAATDIAGPGGKSLPLGTHVERKVLRTRSAHVASATDPAANPLFVQLTGSGGYAVAPVLAAGHVAWFVHADRWPTTAAPSRRERDLLAEFATGLGYQLEHLRRRQALTEQRDRIQLALAEASRIVDELVSDPTLLHTLVPAVPPAHHGTGPASRTVAGAALTARELDVLDLVARGWRNSEVASHLVLGEATIKSHMTSIMRKLRVGSRAEAACVYLGRTVGSAGTP
jgi:DNA-binding CsgD family transcriptional regulator/GAF domain-containing protein